MKSAVTLGLGVCEFFIPVGCYPTRALAPLFLIRSARQSTAIHPGNYLRALPREAWPLLHTLPRIGLHGITVWFGYHANCQLNPQK